MPSVPTCVPTPITPLHSVPTLPVPTFRPMRSVMTAHHCLPSQHCLRVSPPITPMPSVPTCVPTPITPIAFRPDAACADLPSHALRHDRTSLSSVPTLSESVTSYHTHAFRRNVCANSHHTHAFRPDAACADLPSHALRHDRTSLSSVSTLSESVTSYRTHAFRPNVCANSHHTHAFRHDAACADLPSHALHHDRTSLSSVPTLSESVISYHTHAFRRNVCANSHHTIAFRPDAACADLPSHALHHERTSLSSVPTLSESVTSYHTHAFRPNVCANSHHTIAFRPDAACADLPSHALRHDRTSLSSVPTLSESVTSYHTHAFRRNVCQLPSHHCIPSRRCLCRPSVPCAPS